MLYIGLMSGTSLDGVDGVLADLSGAAPSVKAHVHQPFEPTLRTELLALNSSGPDELHRCALAANAVARAYAGIVDELLARTAHRPGQVRAVGAHGQTVRHRPGAFDGTGYTTQLLNGALLAERCGIAVVCDLRSRDLAAGGQGAPLVPAFHAALFARADVATAVLNIGGIANLTLLGDQPREVLGFDCGPGNALMDAWCERHTGRPYDDGGRWAASGQVDVRLLDALLAEPYFTLAPPKSTGRDLFHGGWLAAALRSLAARRSPADVQATLTELTARAAADALRRHAGNTKELLVCGGGAFNSHLMDRLSRLLPGIDVASTTTRGVPADQVEALAFAWLAQRFVERQPGNLPAVTGAKGPRVLGALHLA
jgi:anhydro-N-acetylmuramic acid kinase